MRPIDAEMLKEKLSEAIKDAPLYIQVTVDQYIDEAQAQCCLDCNTRAPILSAEEIERLEAQQ